MNLRSLGIPAALIIGSLWFVPSATSQPPGAAPAKQPSPAKTKDAKDNKSIREQTIYIPYDKLRKVFEKQGRGVYIPYEQFQQLWKAAQKNTQPAPESKRPVDELIREIQSQATIGKQVVNVTATLEIEVLGEGWVSIPLRLRNAAIRTATIDGRSARILFDKAKGYTLLHQKTGTVADRFTLELQYSRKFDKTPGQSTVSFEPPQSPINRWKIIVPEKGITVQVEPMIAATRAPDDKTPESAKRTELLAFVGAAPTVQITWNPKAEGASGLAAFATVQTEQQVVVSEGVMRTSLQLSYDISRSTLTQLEIEVPADQKVVNVYDRNIKRWDVKAADGKQRVLVELFEATRGKQAVVLELEQFRTAADTKTAFEAEAPLVRAIGVGRQQGVVVARFETGLQGEAIQRTGLLQLDQNDLPATLRKTAWDFAYRYGAVPYGLRLRVEKILPRISVTELAEANLTTNAIDLNWLGLFQIEDAGVFQLKVDIPDKFEVRSIAGKTIAKTPAVIVDSYHRIDPDKPTWLVNLSKKAIGKVGLQIRLHQSLNDPNLATPTGVSSTIEFPLPHATADDVEFSNGALVLKAPESLRVNPSEVTGLRNISFTEAYQAIQASRSTPSQLHPVLAYAFTKGPSALTVTAERRKPQITVKQVLTSKIEAGVVKYEAQFFYEIKYSGVKSLRVDVPSDMAAEIRNTTKSLRRSVIAPQPDDVDEGYTAWSIAGETELLGTVPVRLAWEQKIEELRVGTNRKIDLPRLVPRDVDRAQGQIVVSKSESIDIQPVGQPKGLRPIDPQQDIMPQVKVADAAMAFEFVDQWSLTIQATRYEPAEGKMTAVERGVVRVVELAQGGSANAGKLSVQAVYRIRSARQRLSIELPEEASFDAQPLRINGTPVTAERESSTVISAPLADQDIDKPFLLELRYTIPGNASELDTPVFPDDPAVQKVYLCVYLPKKRVLLAGRGPWSNEQGSSFWTIGLHVFGTSDDQLLNWVSEGLKSGLRSARAFPVGQSDLYVYSTLQPAGPPDGSLRLVTINRYLFHGAIILLIAILGLPLFGRSLRSQVTLLLLFVMAIVLAGVFVPELAVATLEGAFPVAIAVLILIWIIGHLSKLRRFRAAAGPQPPPAAEPDSNPFQPDGESSGTPPAMDEAKPDDQAADQPADQTAEPAQPPSAPDNTSSPVQDNAADNQADDDQADNDQDRGGRAND